MTAAVGQLGGERGWMRPVVLTIAGSDSSGGAGIQADLKTFTALGVYGASVVTALTAQNTIGVQRVLATPVEMVEAQLQSVAGDLPIAAIKTGMLGTKAIVEVVAGHMAARAPGVTLVVDPVMVATSGDLLLTQDAIAAMRARLLPLADLVTPNLPEAATLLGLPEATSLDAMVDQGRALLGHGCKAVLMKGGHADGAQAIDVLVLPDAVHTFAGVRIETTNTHGTGCTLSAAITALRAHGWPLIEAVGGAKRYLSSALEAARGCRLGQGHGPVDHAWAIAVPDRRPPGQ